VLGDEVNVYVERKVCRNAVIYLSQGAVSRTCGHLRVRTVMSDGRQSDEITVTETHCSHARGTWVPCRYRGRGLSSALKCPRAPTGGELNPVFH
jgi:hypothetical protein